MREGQPSPEFPDKNFHGTWKEFKGEKNGFSVIWFNADTKVTTTGPGIQIKFCRPDNTIVESERFSPGQEQEAEKVYQEFLKKVKSYDAISK